MWSLSVVMECQRLQLSLIHNLFLLLSNLVRPKLIFTTPSSVNRICFSSNPCIPIWLTLWENLSRVTICLVMSFKMLSGMAPTKSTKHCMLPRFMNSLITLAHPSGWFHCTLCNCKCCGQLAASWCCQMLRWVLKVCLVSLFVIGNSFTMYILRVGTWIIFLTTDATLSHQTVDTVIISSSLISMVLVGNERLFCQLVYGALICGANELFTFENSARSIGIPFLTPSSDFLCTLFAFRPILDTGLTHVLFFCLPKIYLHSDLFRIYWLDCVCCCQDNLPSFCNVCFLLSYSYDWLSHN